MFSEWSNYFLLTNKCWYVKQFTKTWMIAWRNTQMLMCWSILPLYVQHMRAQWMHSTTSRYKKYSLVISALCDVCGVVSQWIFLTLMIYIIYRKNLVDAAVIIFQLMGWIKHSVKKFPLLHNTWHVWSHLTTVFTFHVINIVIAGCTHMQ